MTLRPLFRGRTRLALAALALFACRDAGPVHLTLRPGLSVADSLRAGSACSFAFELRRGQYLALGVP